MATAKAFSGPDPFGGVLDKAVKAELPSQASVFFTPGFIGPLNFRREWEVFAPVDLDSSYYGEEGVPMSSTKIKYSETSYRFTYDDFNKAELALKAIDKTYTGSVIHIFSDVDKILWRSPEIMEKWAEYNTELGGSVRITSFGGDQWNPGVAFNMMFVPCLIEAAARAQAGYINYDAPEEPFMAGAISDIRSLMYKESVALKASGGLADFATILTDELQFSFCGHSKDYINSRLWRARADLFASLGEPDPQRYHAQSEKDKDAGLELKPYETSSPQLLACSRFIESLEWPEPFWARFENIGIPSVDGFQLSKNTGKWSRRDTPIITELFLSKEDALEAFESSGPEGEDGAKKPTDVPPGWATVVDDWYGNVKELREKYKEVEKVPEEEITFLDCTRDQIAAAWENPAVVG